MISRLGILVGLAVLGFLCTAGTAAALDDTGTADQIIDVSDDVPLYDGPIDAGSALYGLKIAWEDLDESFTFNQTARLDKQLNRAKLRLSEVKRELAVNQADTADLALELYWLKLNLTRSILAGNESNITGILHAQYMITRQQTVLTNLMLSHPDNTGLARAYCNSLALEDTFSRKTRVKFERIMQKKNVTIVKAIQFTERERVGDYDQTPEQDQERNRDRIKTRFQTETPAGNVTVTARPTETGTGAQNGREKNGVSNKGINSVDTSDRGSYGNSGKSVK